MLFWGAIFWFWLNLITSAATRKHTMMRQKQFFGGTNILLEEGKNILNMLDKL